MFVLISDSDGLFTSLPNFFCKVFHIFVIIGLTILNIKGVAAAPAVAVIATAGAAATPLILRIVKPIITKIYKTIQKKLGKKVELPTRAEIQTNKYREKKGLPPLKKK